MKYGFRDYRGGGRSSGRETIGRVAAGAVVLEEVPPNSIVVGIPARVVRQDGKKVGQLDQIHIPDPVKQKMDDMDNRIAQLESLISTLGEK